MRVTLLVLLVMLATSAWADSADTARELFEAGRYSEAHELMEPTVGTSASPQDRLLLTSICNRLEDWRCSVEHGKAVAKELPNNSTAQFEYALALAPQALEREQGQGTLPGRRLQGGTQPLLGARLEQPGSPRGGDRLPDQRTGRGGGGDKKKARERVEELEALNWRRGMKMRAQLEDAEDNDAEVGRIFSEVVERYPDDAAARLRLGFWHQDQEQWRPADEQFAQVAESGNEQERLSALYQRGRTQILGGYEAAEAVGAAGALRQNGRRAPAATLSIERSMAPGYGLRAVGSCGRSARGLRRSDPGSTATTKKPRPLCVRSTSRQ